MKNTQKIIDMIKKYKTYLNLIGHVWNILQTDADIKYLSTRVFEYCNSEGINVRTSAPYSHQQNGTAERSIQNIMNSNARI